jgi:hypothetical protein
MFLFTSEKHHKYKTQHLMQKSIDIGKGICQRERERDLNKFTSKQKSIDLFLQFEIVIKVVEHSSYDLIKTSLKNAKMAEKLN